ncbi:MAG: general L-amino acid transport system ATP-binding protein [Candidatus Tokpelaia sp. JSC161]|jgi:general L-amino acid transport system ATP-binding protein|nr:MAG: general L-amino acid transport system ATP-binding protein [Candidatus Tokpelaia sp. JSC161]
MKGIKENSRIHAINIINVNKWLGKMHILRNMDFSVKFQERVALIGPSGSGKSTLLRCINALETFQKGKIIIEGTELNNTPKTIHLIRRRIGMVFQKFNLFPHLTVLENCTLAPIWVKKMNKKKAEEEAFFYLEKVKISDQATKYPIQLSGGQQQRVAIARSLCMKPRMMLFDEPTSALDPEMIQEILDLIMDLTKNGMTIICVTHKMSFARQLAHRIAFMDEGQILEENASDRFFSNPQHERTQIFLRKML